MLIKLNIDMQYVNSHNCISADIELSTN